MAAAEFDAVREDQGSAGDGDHVTTAGSERSP
jgi:hypothetical protein